MFNKLKFWISENKSLARLERTYAVTSNPNFSLTKSLLVKIRVLVEFMVRSILETSPLASWKSEIKNLRKDHFPPVCLVLANGPSVSKLDTTEIVKLQQSEKLHVIAVNNYLQSDLFQSLTPNFLCLSDPAHLPRPTENSSFWKQIIDHPEINLILPKHWYQLIIEQKVPNNCYYFDDRSLELFSKNTKPTRPRGYMSLTALKALAFADWLPYAKVVILGFDNSMFQTLKVDENNNLLQGSNHAKGAANVNVSYMTSFYPNGVSDYFFDLSQIFQSFKLFSKSFKITNIDKNSITDAFPKEEIYVIATPGKHLE